MLQVAYRRVKLYTKIRVSNYQISSACPLLSSLSFVLVLRDRVCLHSPPSLVCDSSIVKKALRHLALSATAPSSRLLRGPVLAQRQRRPSGTPRAGERPKVTHATPSPGKTSDATSSPGPPRQAAGAPGNCREVHLNPSGAFNAPAPQGLVHIHLRAPAGT